MFQFIYGQFVSIDEPSEFTMKSLSEIRLQDLIDAERD
jgi:hypothetical protein